MATTTDAAAQKSSRTYTSLAAAAIPLAALCLAFFVEMVDNTLLSIALPTIGRGPVVYPELLPAALTLPGVDLLDVDAGALAALAATRIAAGADMPVEPLYLRRPDAVAPAAAGGAGAAGGTR